MCVKIHTCFWNKFPNLIHNNREGQTGTLLCACNKDCTKPSKIACSCLV